MARGLVVIGVIGAVLLLVGPGVVAVGEFEGAGAGKALADCTARCIGAARAAANASYESSELLGIGIAIGATGLGFVLLAGLTLMAGLPAGRGGYGPRPPGGPLE